VTSIADPAPRPRGLSWLRALLLVLVLGAFALQTPSPWGVLWLVVPGGVALALLIAWRFGVWGLVVPAALSLAVLVLGLMREPWAWWVPTAALCGVWMGLREEGAETGSGARAWMLLPLLLFAAGLPRTASYPRLIESVEAQLRTGDQELIEIGRQVGYPTDRLAGLQRSIEENASLRTRALPHVLPTLIFLWIAVLVYAGRSLSARTAAALRWPPLTRGRLREWRMPDGALWMFLAGLALLIALTLLFVFAVALPVFVLAAAAMGLSDAWLDFRRLEPASGDHGEENR